MTIVGSLVLMAKVLIFPNYLFMGGGAVHHMTIARDIEILGRPVATGAVKKDVGGPHQTHQLLAG